MFRFRHPAGFASLDVVNVLINTSLDGGKACYVAYSRAADVLYVVDDAGPTAGLGALIVGVLIIGSNGSVANSQCTIYGAESSALMTGNELSLTLRIEYSRSFSGYKAIYLAARDGVGGTRAGICTGAWPFRICRLCLPDRDRWSRRRRVRRSSCSGSASSTIIPLTV